MTFLVEILIVKKNVLHVYSRWKIYIFFLLCTYFFIFTNKVQKCLHYISTLCFGRVKRSGESWLIKYLFIQLISISVIFNIPQLCSNFRYTLLKNELIYVCTSCQKPDYVNFFTSTYNMLTAALYFRENYSNDIYYINY